MMLTAKRRDHFVRLGSDVRSDLTWWLRHLEWSGHTPNHIDTQTQLAYRHFRKLGLCRDMGHQMVWL